MVRAFFFVVGAVAFTLAVAGVLLPLLPEGGPLLQLGSGAGRLAFELGRSRPVIALDMNPLLALLVLLPYALGIFLLS